MLRFSVDKIEIFQDTSISPFVFRIEGEDDEFSSFDVKIYAEGNNGYYALVKRKEDSFFKEREEFSSNTTSFAFDIKIERYSPFFKSKEEFKFLVKQQVNGEVFTYEIPVEVVNTKLLSLERYVLQSTFSGKKLFLRVIPGSKIKLKLGLLFYSSFSTAKLLFQQFNFNCFIVKEDEFEINLEEGFTVEDIELEIDEGARFLVLYSDYCLGTSLLEVEYKEIGNHLTANLINGWLPRYLRNDEYRRFISLSTLALNDLLYFMNNFEETYKLEKFPYLIVRELGKLFDFYVPSDNSLARKIVPLLLNLHTAGTLRQIEMIMEFLYSGIEYEVETQDNEVYIYVEDTFDENRDPLAVGLLREFGAAHVRYNLVLTQVSFIIGVSDYLEVYTYLR